MNLEQSTTSAVVSGHTSSISSHLSRDEMERRRLMGAELLRKGVRQNAVARNLGVSRTAVSRWNKSLENCESLLKRRSTGRRPRITGEQAEKLALLFNGGPEAIGLETKKWTIDSFCAAAREYVGVQYHRDHMGRIMHTLGFKTPRMRGKKR